jgi:hypothetical protein
MAGENKNVQDVETEDGMAKMPATPWSTGKKVAVIGGGIAGAAIVGLGIYWLVKGGKVPAVTVKK